jgi:hypothetical protein
MKDPSANIRIRAVQMPGFLYSAAAAVTLVDALKDHDPFVRTWAATALFGFGEFGVTKILSSLEGSDPITRRALAESLVIGQALNMATDVSESTLRRAAVETLAYRCNEVICVSSFVLPEYSLIVKAGRITGRVLIDVEIDAGGRVTQTSSEGHALLRKAVEDAVKRWVFEWRGKVIENYHHIIAVDFEMAGTSEDPGFQAVSTDLPNGVRVVARPPHTIIH